MSIDAAHWATLWSESRAPWAPWLNVAQPTNAASAMLGAMLAVHLAQLHAYTWQNWAVLAVIELNLLASCDAHASLHPLSVWVDARSLLLALWVCFLPIACDPGETRRDRLLASAGFLKTLLIACFNSDAAFAVGLIICAVLLWLRAWGPHGFLKRRSVVRAVLLLLSATACWLVDRFVPGAAVVYLLPHAGWHLLGAAGVACLCNAV